MSNADQLEQPRLRTGVLWKVAAGVAALAVAAFGAVLVAGALSDTALTAFTDLGQLTAAMLGGFGAGWAASRAWRTDRQRLAISWWFISAGVWAWAWGEAVWTGYEVVLGEEVPFPSLADVGFLGLPLLAGVGLLLWPVGVAEGRDRVNALLDGALIGAGLLLVSWATSLGATIQAGAENTLAAAIGAAYPVGDVVLAALVVLLLTRAAPTNRASLLLLSAGLVSLAVADSAFMYGTSTGSYASGGVLDVGWFAGFLAIGVAGLAMGASPVTRTRHRHAVGWQRLSLPYVPAGVALLVAAGALLAGHSLHVVEVLCTLVIVLAVVARQFLVMADNHELLQTVEAGEAELRAQAFRDELTGLVNRRLFEDRLDHALRCADRDGLSRALLVVDLDNFRLVEQGLGTAAGDQVLAEVADRLLGSVRAGDTVARLEGDAFAVLLEAGHQAPERVAQRVVRNLRTVVDVGGQPLPVTASVGLAVVGPRQAGTPGDELLGLAARALEQAKAAGKDRFTAVAAMPREGRTVG